MSRPSATAAGIGLLVALLLPGVFAATCGSSQSSSQSIGPNGEYNCGYDWNGNGFTKDDAGDIVACLVAARLAARTSEGGTDAGVTVLLPSGRFDLSSVIPLPFQLVGGMNIRGVYPRVAYQNIGAPDGTMSLPDGGTWLLGSGPGSVIFTGNQLRGVTLENLGFSNFGKALSVGGDGVDGMSFSVLRNLIAVPNDGCTAPACIAFELNNIQHVRIDHLECGTMATCLDVINQNSQWQGANSVITDVSHTSATAGSRGGIILEVRKPSSGACQSLNYVTLIRPQVGVVAPAPVAGTSAILLTVDPACPSGRPNGIGIYDADIEGAGAECGIRLERAEDTYVNLAATNSRPPTFLFCADQGSVANVWVSRSLQTTTRFANKSNLFFGFADISAQTNMIGVFRDSAGNWRNPGMNGQPAQSGSMFWGDPTNLQPATGGQVCLEQGLVCEVSYDPGSAAAQSCGAIHASRFFALCR